MKKYAMDMRVTEVERLNNAYALIKLTPADEADTRFAAADILPGQFVQVEVPASKTTYLRRPISVNFVDESRRELWLLVRDAGAGTASLIASEPGDVLNLVMPLGHGFTTDFAPGSRVLLAGGGVGVAPLLYLGKCLAEKGVDVVYALGARSAADLLLLDEFERYGEVHVATEDGSMGIKGFVTLLPVFDSGVTHIACCGPTPMMKAVAAMAKTRDIECEVSLENMMACGLGACLCCVEDTADKGNVCVCTDGPVFNINRLKWTL